MAYVLSWAVYNRIRCARLIGPKQKNAARSDPKPHPSRTAFMFQETSAVLDSSPGSQPLAVVTQKPVKNRDAKFRRLRQTDDKEAHWVECLRRINSDKDRKAFTELFAHFAPRVKAFLMKSGADASLAEECSQDVLATVWRKAHLFDPSRASVATWVFTIARNRRIDALRKQRRPEPEELTWGPEEEPDQADVMTLQQENARLAKAIAELPEKQRILIEQAYFGDLSHSEIASETGLPLGTIKSRIRLALDRLRHKLK